MEAREYRKDLLLNHTITRKRNWIFITANVIAAAFIVVGIFALAFNDATAKQIGLLPLTYGILLLISKKNKQLLQTISVLIINIVAAIRYGIYPGLILLKYIQTGGIPEYDLFAINLMCYEIICVFFVIYIFGRTNLSLRRTTEFAFRLGHFGIMSIMFFCLFGVAVVLFPSLLNKFYIFSAIQQVKVPGAWMIIFTIGLMYTYVLTLKFIYQIKTKIGELGAFFLSIVLMIFYALCNVNLAYGQVNRWQFLFAVISSFVIFWKMYRKHHFQLVIITIALCAVGGFWLTMLKFGSNQSFFMNTPFLDAYFSGIDQVTQGIAVRDRFAGEIGTTTLANDLFSAIPLLNHLYYDAGNSTVSLFHSFTHRTDNILPTLAQGYIYFGTLGAPIFSMICTLIALIIDKICRQQKDIYIIFILTYVIILVSLFMCINITIIQENIWSLFVLLFVLFFDKHIVLTYSKDNIRYSRT